MYLCLDIHAPFVTRIEKKWERREIVSRKKKYKKLNSLHQHKEIYTHIVDVPALYWIFGLSDQIQFFCCNLFSSGKRLCQDVWGPVFLVCTIFFNTSSSWSLPMSSSSFPKKLDFLSRSFLFVSFFFLCIHIFFLLGAVFIYKRGHTVQLKSIFFCCSTATPEKQ